MKFKLPDNSQFACVALRPLSVSPELSNLFPFENGLYAVINPEFEIEDFWREQLGKIKDQLIRKSNLIVVGVIDSDRSDGWYDRELRRYVSSVVQSLYMQRMYCEGGGVMLCGGCANGRVDSGNFQMSSSASRGASASNRSRGTALLLSVRGSSCRRSLISKPDISPHIPYNHPARKWGRQASTGAVTSVAMHAGPSLWGPLSKRRETQLPTLTS